MSLSVPIVSLERTIFRDTVLEKTQKSNIQHIQKQFPQTNFDRTASLRSSPNFPWNPCNNRKAQLPVRKSAIVFSGEFLFKKWVTENHSTRGSWASWVTWLAIILRFSLFPHFQMDEFCKFFSEARGKLDKGQILEILSNEENQEKFYTEVFDNELEKDYPLGVVAIKAQVWAFWNFRDNS